MSKEHNIKLVLAYDGTRYNGWQRQLKQPSIQGALEDALTRMTSEKINVQGAGRTDSGVHALAMTANFFTRKNIPCAGFLKGLNSILPTDIRVVEVMEAAADFHACHSATAKTYSYTVWCGPIQLPTERFYAVHIVRPLNIKAMESALKILEGCHDFSSFEAAGSRDPLRQTGRGAIRTIIEARLEVSSGLQRLCFLFKGDGFLRHMVRNIVGTLLEIGKGRLAAVDMAEILAAKNRAVAGPTAPAHGLFLIAVHYD